MSFLFFKVFLVRFFYPVTDASFFKIFTIDSKHMRKKSRLNGATDRLRFLTDFAATSLPNH